MADQDDAAAHTAPTDDIRTALSQAIAAQEADPEAGGDAGVAPEPRDAAADAPPASGEDARAAPEPESATQADAAAPAEATEPPAGPPAREAPANWKASDRAMFRALPEAAQEFVLARHKAMEADHTRKTQAIAELKREYEPVDEVFAPYRELMKTRGLTARDLIEGWVNVERRLAEGDGINVIKGLVAGYKLDPGELARALGISSPPAAAPAGPPATPNTPAPSTLPPELLAEVARLRQRADAEDRAKAETARAAQLALREKFIADMEELKTATDADGNLRHPYVAEVAEDMAHLALAAKSRGQAIPPLQELYEKAVRANPSTYESQRIAEAQSADRQRQAEARAKAAAARKASASVSGAPGSGQPPRARPSGRSLREELEAAADEAA